MAYRKVDETSLTAVADAIRTKGGTTEPLTFPDGFVSAVEGITSSGGSSGGGEWTTDGIANGSEPNGELTITGTEIAQYALAYRTGITRINAPNVTKIGKTALEGMNLTDGVYFPELVDIGSQAFLYATVPEIYLPKTPKISNFRLAKIKKVECPIATEIANSAFSENTTIQVVIGPKVTNISNYAFTITRNLKALVLASQTVVTLAGTNNFTQAPVFTVYVPESLISEYQTATNWSTFYESGALTFAAIEGSEYE